MPNFQVLIIENDMGSMKNKKIIMWLISNDEYKKYILGFLRNLKLNHWCRCVLSTTWVYFYAEYFGYNMIFVYIAFI